MQDVSLSYPQSSYSRSSPTLPSTPLTAPASPATLPFLMYESSLPSSSRPAFTFDLKYKMFSLRAILQAHNTSPLLSPASSPLLSFVVLIPHLYSELSTVFSPRLSCGKVVFKQNKQSLSWRPPPSPHHVTRRRPHPPPQTLPLGLFSAHFSQHSLSILTFPPLFSSPPQTAKTHRFFGPSTAHRVSLPTPAAKGNADPFSSLLHKHTCLFTLFYTLSPVSPAQSHCFSIKNTAPKKIVLALRTPDFERTKPV